ncbi:MAG: histidinol-phosphate transaminase [Candidatus Accumulibacter sp.]|jgi:histidinol-phosphate aminotransferase|nr:histidinol-phosphate transaminase [Accumulibacter sp.]
MAIYDQSLSNVRAISPYQPGKPITMLAREMGIPVENIVKLASNENPFGMSPKARAAIEAALGGLERYPDDFELKAALASRTGLGADHIVLGNGSNDILDIAARVFLAHGRSAVFSRHAFAVYPLATITAGAEPIVVPAKDYGHDLEAMLAAIRPDTRVVWIANPNNPTGTFLTREEIGDFLARVPADVAVVLDEAYNDYIPSSERFDSLGWLGNFPNLIVSRTFSKIYGMAGLRVGYGMASPEIADLMNRVRQPFNCNNLALAGAIAALDDAAFIEKSHTLNLAGKEQIERALKKLGLACIPSYGNFVALKVGDAKTVNEKLLKQGVIVRPVAGYDMPEWLRVTIGSEYENKRFIDALEKALG